MLFPPVNLVMVMILAALSAAAMLNGAEAFDKPFLVMAKGKPINVDIGHAAPCVVDWNKDGLNDLLVGQFGEGKLRIYLNKGSKNQPKFDDFTYFQAGGTTATVPSG